MGSSTSKGNISTLLLVVTLLVMIVSIVILAELMVSDKARAGKYVNPYVASQVVRGTIYDRNGRALAMEVPKTNIYVNSETHSVQEISQILAVHTDKTPDEIISRIERQSKGMVLVVSDVPYNEVSPLKEEIEKAGFGPEEVSIAKEYTRDYPALFHAAQLIDETETVFDHVLSPIPGFDESTTYGKDVYLTIDFDIQYLLDLAVQQVYEVHSPEYCVAFIIDISSGEILATTTYPFYDLNASSDIPQQQRICRSIVSTISRSNIRIDNIHPVSKVTEHDSDSVVYSYKADRGYTMDLDIVRDLLRFADGKTSIACSIPSSEPKYLVFIGSVNPKYNQLSSVMDAAIESIEAGLRAQGKL